MATAAEFALLSVGLIYWATTGRKPLKDAVEL
jgi:hypothetical protein